MGRASKKMLMLAIQSMLGPNRPRFMEEHSGGSDQLHWKTFCAFTNKTLDL